MPVKTCTKCGRITAGNDNLTLPLVCGRCGNIPHAGCQAGSAELRRYNSKISRLEREIEERKEASQRQNSYLLKTFLDLKVMIENDETDEALEMLTELTG